MRVVVKFHEPVAVELRAWQARLSQPPAGDPVLARFHLEELVRSLQEAEGKPAGARVDRGTDPESWIWEYATETWVRYILRDTKSKPFGRTTREVIIVSVAAAPPP